MRIMRGTARTPPTWWSEIVRVHGHLLPKPPSESVKPTRTPEPPKVPPGTGPKVVAAIARGYYAACMHHYGVCRAFRSLPTSSTVIGSKFYTALEDSAQKLREYHLPPVAWSAFSISVWQTYVVGGAGGAWNKVPSQHRGPRASSQPTPGWVFSLKRLEGRTEWFGWEQAQWRGGKVIFTPAYKKLQSCYEDLRTRLRLEPKLTAEKVEELVHLHLPARRYTALVTKATDEAEVEADRIAELIKRGGWVW